MKWKNWKIFILLFGTINVPLFSFVNTGCNGNNNSFIDIQYGDTITINKSNYKRVINSVEKYIDQYKPAISITQTKFVEIKNELLENNISSYVFYWETIYYYANKCNKKNNEFQISGWEANKDERLLTNVSFSYNDERTAISNVQIDLEIKENRIYFNIDNFGFAIKTFETITIVE